MLKIKIFLKSGPSTGMNYPDFRLTFVEPVWINKNRRKIARIFLKSLTYNKPIEI